MRFHAGLMTIFFTLTSPLALGANSYGQCQQAFAQNQDDNLISVDREILTAQLFSRLSTEDSVLSALHKLNVLAERTSEDEKILHDSFISHPNPPELTANDGHIQELKTEVPKYRARVFGIARPALDKYGLREHSNAAWVLVETGSEPHVYFTTHIRFKRPYINLTKTQRIVDRKLAQRIADELTYSDEHGSTNESHWVEANMNHPLLADTFQWAMVSNNHWALRNQSNSELTRLQKFLGLRSHLLNSRVGVRLEVPTVKSLNRISNSLGGEFKSLQFVDWKPMHYRKNLEWGKDPNLELFASILARGEFPIETNFPELADYLVLVPAAYLLPSKIMSNAQEVSKLFVEKISQATTLEQQDEVRKSLQRFTHSFKELLTTMGRLDLDSKKVTANFVESYLWKSSAVLVLMDRYRASEIVSLKSEDLNRELFQIKAQLNDDLIKKSDEVRLIIPPEAKTASKFSAEVFERKERLEQAVTMRDSEFKPQKRPLRNRR